MTASETEYWQEPSRYATNANVQSPMEPGLGARLSQEYAVMDRMTRAELHAKYWPDGGPEWLFGPPKPAAQPKGRLCESYLLEWIREITRTHAGHWLSVSAELEQRTLENNRLQKQIRDHDQLTHGRRLNGGSA